MSGRGSAGRRLRARLDAALPETHEWTERDLEVLRLVEATANDIEALEAKVRVQGRVVKGAGGQPRVHPALAEIRQLRMTLAKLLDAVQMPDDGPGSTVTSRRAQRAANARWDRVRVVGES